MPQRSVRLFDDESQSVDQFGALLALTSASVVILSLVGASDAPGVPDLIRSTVVTALVGGTLLLALRASGVAKLWRRIAGGFVGLATCIALVLTVTSAFSDQPIQLTVRAAPVVWVILAVLAPLVVVRRLVRHRTVDRRTVMGAVSVYLLIPVAYHFMFLSADALQGDVFGTPVSSTSFMYFSLVTLTTLGYGDLVPVTDVGRLLATSEAVIGQVFLVTFVALFVGLLAQRWRPPTGAASGPNDSADQRS